MNFISELFQYIPAGYRRSVLPRIHAFEHELPHQILENTRR